MQRIPLWRKKNKKFTLKGLKMQRIHPWRLKIAKNYAKKNEKGKELTLKG